MEHSVEAYIKRLPNKTLLNALSNNEYIVFHKEIMIELYGRGVDKDIILNHFLFSNYE